MFTDALKIAIETRGVRLVDLANSFGVNKAAVTRWNQIRVPEARLSAIEERFGIPPHILRPDVFPPPSAALPGADGLPSVEKSSGGSAAGDE